jgi:transposase
VKSVSKFSNIYLCRSFVDFRLSIDGLSAIVAQELLASPLSGALFVFTNSRRNRLKMLYWDRTGMALWYKRLEKGVFPWPREGDQSIAVEPKLLKYLLDGIDIWKIKPHDTVNYQEII